MNLPSSAKLPGTALLRWLVPLAALLAVVLLTFGADDKRALEDRLWQHRNLGKAFYENPTTQAQAVDEFNKALDLAPRAAREQLNYALALLRAGKTPEAVAQLQKVQKSNPELPHTWFNLGIVFKKEGDFDKSLPQFERMVQLTPNEPVARYNLGVLYKQIGRLDEAAREFQAAVRLNPNLAAPHFQLYNLLRTTGKRDEAARELQEFQRLKKSQEGAAIPEDMEWCDYAEVYDPIDALPVPAPASIAYTEQKLPGTVDSKTAGWTVVDGEVIVWSARGLISKRPGFEGLKEVRSVAAGDFDNDGRMDAAVVTASGVSLCRNEGAKFSCKELLAGSWDSAVWLDYDHDYDLDLILLGASSKLMRNQGTAGFADRTADFPFETRHALQGEAVRIQPDSKSFDLLVTNADGTKTIFADRLNGKYEIDRKTKPASLPALGPANGKDAVIAPNGTVTIRAPKPPAAWLSVSLKGVKNLKLAQGSYVEIKAGLLYERKRYDGEPLLFDLRGKKEADTVRITWPNGLIQNEVHQAANKAYKYEEAQRLSGSCPMIWTWNGQEFEFLTDVLGIAPLGASSGDGSYFPVDHDEYVQIPARALQPKDGALEIRVTEELSEVTYLDQIRLYAVDHPADSEVFINEKWKGPPFPQFRFYGAKQRIYPSSARDAAGKDVLDLLTKRDARYPNEFARTENGIAELHALTLDFAGAAPDNRAVLILNGWVDWADGSTFMAAAQESKTGLTPPYLQVKDASGAWKTVIEDMGMPDGKPKTIAVDLTGKFLSTDRQVRIVTNLCVYWDEIFISESSAIPVLHQTTLPAKTAEVRFRGFSASQVDPERKQPERFFYATSTPLSYWNPTPGLYTRYGDVRELLETVDDRFVVMGSGDEIRLRFDPRALPAVPAGWTREYLLKVDGWAKDRDANTAYSQSVAPLPFHAMSSYPYPKGEQYPRDAVHRRYLNTYNTRPALRLIRPLEAGK